MSANRRAAEAEQLERRLLASPSVTPTRLCDVVDVLPAIAADGRSLVVVDWDGDGTRIQVGRARSYAPAVGDLAVVALVEGTPVALDALVALPPE